MLRQLRISNVILIDNIDISFENGLNIVTGETGAGKSSIMQALALALGGRAESSMIRKDTSKAIIEANFVIHPQNALFHLLNEAGISYEQNEPVVIRREIAAGGKNRSFINDQIAPVSLIEAIAPCLIDIVGQHSHQKLLTLSYHREILDCFGRLQPLLNQVKAAWEEEIALRKELKTLEDSTPGRLREMDVCRMELEELRSARIREGEEEILFQEYSRLSHAEEIAAKTQEITSALKGGRQGILPFLHKQKSILEDIVEMDASLADTLLSFQNTLIELEDAHYTLERYQEKLESNPKRLGEINERLNVINRIKRKYGNTVEEIERCQSSLDQKLKQLEIAGDQIPELQERLGHMQAKSEMLAEELSKKRHEASAELERLLTCEIRSLNMPKATIQVKISRQQRGILGIDKIECYFSPNVGEQMIPLKECASGGELSRILLAVKTVLAGKDHVPTLVFDEIDANLGGETASIVGDKLNSLGKEYQVLCITHLPQVASQGEHHFQIYKEERMGRTVAEIIKLDKKSRHLELTRMLGGISFNTATKDLAEKILNS